MSGIQSFSNYDTIVLAVCQTTYVCMCPSGRGTTDSMYKKTINTSELVHACVRTSFVFLRESSRSIGSWWYEHDIYAEKAKNNRALERECASHEPRHRGRTTASSLNQSRHPVYLLLDIFYFLPRLFLRVSSFRALSSFRRYLRRASPTVKSRISQRNYGRCSPGSV